MSHRGGGGSSSSSSSQHQRGFYSGPARGGQGSSQSQGGPSTRGGSGPGEETFQPFQESQFDIFEWYPQFQSCVRYFLDHAQHSVPVQAVAAFVNIKLPCQRPANPIMSSKPAPGSGPSSPSGGAGSSRGAAGKVPMVSPIGYVTLVPYIRRLVATGFDFPAVLHGFFGDDWAAGVGPLHEAERRNYLFATKSDTWLRVKTNYDMGDEQMIPFLRPLQNVTEKEIRTSETSWSEWLAMQDWMVGPRAPPDVAGQANIKAEED